MNKFYVYVLESKIYRKRYKGLTQDLDNRLKEHNSGKTKSTRAFTPWSLVYYEEFSSIEEARTREKYMKTAAGRRFLNKVLGPVDQRIPARPDGHSGGE